jgi:hypothetical protein
MKKSAKPTSRRATNDLPVKKASAVKGGLFSRRKEKESDDSTTEK